MQAAALLRSALVRFEADIDQFCSTCGIRAAGRGERGPSGGPFYFVPIAALDNVDPDELAAAPIGYVDGRNGRYDQPPKDTV
jgi:hypothetical protein